MSGFRYLNTPSKLSRLLILHEDVVPYAYKDSLGYWTIGVGFLIDKAKGGRMPQPVIDFWLDYELKETAKELEASAPWTTGLDEVRLAVLVDMAYNLGVPGLLKFTTTLGHVKAGNYAAASETMLQSKWATQVGSRAIRLSKMMRSGEWPGDLPSD
jgi:lysozyme